MPSDYASIRDDNVRRYGTDIGRIGPMLLADRYDDRTHFIFELLQNGEDALARRDGWQGSRAMRFNLSATELRVAHCGKPFDKGDVRGICGIAEGTKDLTAIGRFGIGFKSVYAFTDRPEVHSGEEDFAIESFVWPTDAPPVDCRDDETVIVLPLKAGDDADREEITRGLQRLGPGTLLFLRQIEEIVWTVEGGSSGLYMRSKPEAVGENVRRITVIGKANGKPDVEEAWLVISREAKTPDGAVAGYVEIAFSIVRDEESDRWLVKPVSDSPLVVFFPTVLPTYLGFLVQGPYRTTPSRDNVPRNDPWNQYLVRETAGLLVEALRWLRDHDMLDTAALLCLPLNRDKFSEGTMFAPLFQATRNALVSEPLLPRFGGGHVSASMARLARTQELRELFGPSQLVALFGHDGERAWLSGDITQDRTPELHQYLMRELGVIEVTPETLLPKLDKAFLEAQPENWVRELYEFLNGQPALLRQGRLGALPLVRLESGMHVAARLTNGQLQAFLPSAIETGFPTVRRTVCGTEEARKFLQSLGLTEPDLVDDVVRNVLPRRRGILADVDDKDYEADIRRILTAFATDSKGQREKLRAELRETSFVMAVDAADGSKWASKPGDIYLATERLKQLFAGVAGVLLVDDSYACLKGENVRDLLEACGATRYLRPRRVPPTVPPTRTKLLQLRERAGTKETRSEEHIEDWSLDGLEPLLRTLSTPSDSLRRRKGELLWEALSDLEQPHRSVFTGTYRGQYYGPKQCEFEPAFLELLHGTAWVPDANGDLQRPEFVVFDTLGWKSNPFLLSKIRFKPPIIETLAKEAGIEPGMLDLLKKLGVTTEAELKARLGIKEEPQQPQRQPGPETADDDQDDAHEPMPAPAGASDAKIPGAGSGGGGIGGGRSSTGRDGEGGTREGREGRDATGDRTQDAGTGASARIPGSSGGRPFISYVGVHPDDEPDPYGLHREVRMALEEKAIELILAREPKLHRTPPGNPGYDLFEAGEDGEPIRWVEVKAMTGYLNDRPVGLSHTQFECARAHREAFWLYVVEHVRDDANATIVRINNPAGKARTFTFDHGWKAVAEPG